MNISKKQLKLLIHEVLNEADSFNPFKQHVGKSTDTAAANAAAQAEFDRLDAAKGKKMSGSVVPQADYTIDYEKRMKNLIIRRDAFEKRLSEINAQLNVLGRKLTSIKSATEQLALLNSQVKPLMDEKEKILSDLKDIYEAMKESWGEVYKKHIATLASLKRVK
jgi:uncharacterized protein (UPF0335 family)